MTEEEIKKYLNQVAFSSAQEFLEKYKDYGNIIGNFGLGLGWRRRFSSIYRR